MGSGWEPWPSLLRKKTNHVLLKLFLSILLVGICFRLFFSQSDSFLPVSEPIASPATAETKASEALPDVVEDDARNESPETDYSMADKSGALATPIPEMALDFEDQSAQKDPPTAKKSGVLDAPVPKMALDFDGQSAQKDSPMADKSGALATSITEMTLDFEDQSAQKDPPTAKKSGALDAPVPKMALDFDDQSAQEDLPTADRSGSLSAPVPEMTLDFDDQYSQKGNAEKCNLFAGQWIRNPLGPAYTNTSCPFIETPQNCLKNGRPDTHYLYWRWKPNGCDLPTFDPERFLDAMQNKAWALIGDSIFRNHVQSLMCLLSKVEDPVEVYHSDTYKSRRWHFNSHNFTLSLIWAPFLVKADVFEDDNGVSTSEIELHLDTLDNEWTSQYHNFDYVMISGGQWFLKTAIYLENNTVAGCHYCPGRNLTELGFGTWTPDHFENGEWFSGGTCNRTLPYKEGEYNGRDVDRLMRDIELEEFKKATVNGTAREARLKLLDTYYLSLLRPDGHSGPYRNFHPFDKSTNTKVQNDCLHWCLPGPIDTWNDLVMEMVLNQ